MSTTSSGGTSCGLQWENQYSLHAGSHKKVVGYGAIADDGTQIFRIYEKFDTATFSRYLDELRHKYGRILVLVDGAAPHRSKAAMDYLAKHHATVALRRFPIGSPHMNAIEETWRRSELDTKCVNITARWRA